MTSPQACIPTAIRQTAATQNSVAGMLTIAGQKRAQKKTLANKRADQLRRQTASSTASRRARSPNPTPPVQMEFIRPGKRTVEVTANAVENTPSKRMRAATASAAEYSPMKKVRAE